MYTLPFKCTKYTHSALKHASSAPAPALSHREQEGMKRQKPPQINLQQLLLPYRKLSFLLFHLVVTLVQAVNHFLGDVKFWVDVERGRLAQHHVIALLLGILLHEV